MHSSNLQEVQCKDYVASEPAWSWALCSAEEAAGLGACMLQPSLAGIDCPSVVETAAAAVFTHLDPAVRRVRARKPCSNLHVPCKQLLAAHQRGACRLLDKPRNETLKLTC